MKLSIVIPMYGVEKYIEKCLLSCINQESACLGVDYEIICVNDGTKDKSAVLARSIADKHEGIIVIDQEKWWSFCCTQHRYCCSQRRIHLVCR